MSMHRHPDTIECRDDCAARVPIRNHYFTGKLLVERDFVDEQWYFREKIRLHHQRLHGNGVVCGLRVRQHPNPACQDRLVILEPGSAIDCCGHDILVPHPETFDISGVPAIAALIQAQDAKPHVLEFCLEWRECPTEEIPILYDECGCDDTQCAPNRILEAFELKVTVDPPARPAHMHKPKFDWDASIAIAHPTAIALDEANGRVFVVAGTPNGTLYQVATDHLTIDASLPLGRPVLDIAVSPDGHTLYVALAGSGPGATPDLWVLQPDAAGGLALPAVSTVTLSGADTALALTMAADGRLLVSAPVTGNLWLLAAGVPTTGATLAPTASQARSAGAFSSDGHTAWFGGGSTTLVSAALGTGTPVPASVTLSGASGAAADGVAVIATGTGADHLAVLDKAAKALRLADTSGAISASATLADAPASVLITQGGGFALAVSAQAIQVVDLGALANGAANPVGADFALPATVGRAALTASGRRLFAPFSGSAVNQGAVAVIDILDADCKDLLRGHDCPHCDTPDCLVLARVENWMVGDRLEDPTDPPSTAAADQAAGIARLDNSARRVLPSTQAIAEALLCLMEQTCPQTAPQPQPTPSAPPTYAHLSAISWPHAGTMSVQGETAFLDLAFDAPVQAIDLLQPTALRARISRYEAIEAAGAASAPARCWCDLPMRLEIASVAPPGPIPNLQGAPGTSTSWISANGATATTTCTGARIAISVPVLNAARLAAEKVKQECFIEIELDGDLVRDASAQHFGVDGNHVPPWLPQSKPLASVTGKTGDGINGGVFRSWFRLIPVP